MAKIKKSFGQQTIGGGGSGSVEVTPNSNLYYIVGGNSLTYLGANGIKHVTTTITTAVSGYSNGSPATLPDGCGWIRSLDDNTYQIAVNDAGSYITYDIASQPVYAIQDGSITGASWSYPKYRIVGAF